MCLVSLYKIGTKIKVAARTGAEIVLLNLNAKSLHSYYVFPKIGNEYVRISICFSLQKKRFAVNTYIDF